MGWRGCGGLTLCCHSIVARTNMYTIHESSLPENIKANLKSSALVSDDCDGHEHGHPCPDKLLKEVAVQQKQDGVPIAMGPFTYDVSANGGRGGVSQMLTFADSGGVGGTQNADIC